MRFPGALDHLRLEPRVAARPWPPCAGARLVTMGHNVATDNTCGFDPGLGDRVVADPLLGDLADNGGPTLTRALLPGSPAVDVADPAACLPVDQRGYGRPVGASCDAGAFELGAGLAPTGAPPPTAVPSPGPTPSPSATAPPTVGPFPTATLPSTVAPTPVPSCVCREVRMRVPAVVVADALANPRKYNGWGMPLDPGKPVGPSNPGRRCLALLSPSVAYHPLWNRPQWRAGCR